MRAKPLFVKLGAKPGARVAVLDAPAGFVVPAAAATRLASEFDVILAFATSLAALRARAPALKRALAPAGGLWVAWQKGGVTDLGRDNIHALAVAIGLDGVSSCAVDEVWSALKIMYPKDQRR